MSEEIPCEHCGNYYSHKDRCLSWILKSPALRTMEVLEKLQAENAKLRECVEFYAESKKYQGYSSNKTGEYEYYQAQIIGDSGKRARQCLKELEE